MAGLLDPRQVLRAMRGSGLLQHVADRPAPPGPPDNDDDHKFYSDPSYFNYGPPLTSEQLKSQNFRAYEPMRNRTINGVEYRQLDPGRISSGVLFDAFRDPNDERYKRHLEQVEPKSWYPTWMTEPDGSRTFWTPVPPERPMS